MKNKREYEISPFEHILGAENLASHNHILNKALYGEHNSSVGKPSKKEIEKLIKYYKIIKNFVDDHYRALEQDDLGSYWTRLNANAQALPKLYLSRWKLYLEHIERVKRNYLEESNSKAQDFIPDWQI